MSFPETVIIGIAEIKMVTTAIVPSGKHELEIAWNSFPESANWMTVNDLSDDPSPKSKRFKFVRSHKSVNILGRDYPYFGFAGLLPCECRKCKDGDTCATDTDR